MGAGTGHGTGATGPARGARPRAGTGGRGAQQGHSSNSSTQHPPGAGRRATEKKTHTTEGGTGGTHPSGTQAHTQGGRATHTHRGTGHTHTTHTTRATHTTHTSAATHTDAANKTNTTTDTNTTSAANTAHTQHTHRERQEHTHKRERQDKRQEYLVKQAREAGQKGRKLFYFFPAGIFKTGIRFLLIVGNVLLGLKGIGGQGVFLLTKTIRGI